MPGHAYIGIDTPVARTDTSRVRGVAAELVVIGNTANQAAAGVGLTTNGAALLNAADDLGTISGTVIRSSDHADSYVIGPNGAIVPLGGQAFDGAFGPAGPTAPGSISLLTGGLPADITPAQLAELSLITNLDGATITRAEFAGTAGTDKVEGGITIFTEVQQLAGQPTIARTGVIFSADVGVPGGVFGPVGVALDKVADLDIHGEIEIYEEYVVPDGTTADALGEQVWGGYDELPNATEFFADSNLDRDNIVGGGVRIMVGAGVANDQLVDNFVPDWISEDVGGDLVGGVEVGAEANVSFEVKYWDGGPFSVSVKPELGAEADVSAPFNLWSGQGDVGAGLGVTYLNTGEAHHLLWEAAASQGHASGHGVGMPEAAGPFGWSVEAMESGDDLGERQVVTHCTWDGSGQPCEVSHWHLAGNEQTLTGEREGILDVSVSHSMSQTTITNVTPPPSPPEEHCDPLDVTPIGTPAPGPPTPVPVPAPEPPCEKEPEPIGTPGPPPPMQHHYLPFLGDTSGPEPEEPPIEPEPTPVYEPIKDWPPIGREEQLYLQEPELVQRPPAQPETYVVQEGDNLWYVSEEQLMGENGGEGPVDEEFLGYWHDLQDINADDFRYEGNPDMIFEGQEFTLPSEPEVPSYFVKPQ